MEYVIRYHLEPGKVRAFCQWLAANKERLHSSVPYGWRYRGTFFTVQTSFDPSCETRWQLCSREPPDTESLLAFHDLTKELSAFVDDLYPVQGFLLEEAEERDL